MPLIRTTVAMALALATADIQATSHSRIEEITGMYVTPPSEGRRGRYAQITSIERDIFWLAADGKLSAVKATRKNGVITLNYLNGSNAGRAQYEIKKRTLTVTYPKAPSIELKKPIHPAHVQTFLRSSQHANLYEIDEAGDEQGDVRFKKNFFALGKDMQMIEQQGPNGNECPTYLLLIDLNEPVREQYEIARIVVRGFIVEEGSSDQCRPLDIHRHYVIKNHEIDGYLYFNKQGNPIALAIASYMTGLAYVNGKFLPKDTLDLLIRFDQEFE
ncbi:hypothetical protein M2650_06770 [Luteimonas sp. SX5]|uniref:DUF3108 domain-containing protein n=1 Tax=Luteimonas galliterrae TaxID=2940486 RepID=A0ABT0MHI4_9GAMM|nr:hypothetical protein [Luteimonas galliterrae]MCL1634336.1 hypothetical protein [Luteimonas galliterrae]